MPSRVMLERIYVNHLHYDEWLESDEEEPIETDGMSDRELLEGAYRSSVSIRRKLDV